ncbi:preprotein translocase subunit SecB [Flavobacterium gillisiae]|jgi:preprotein translocase subunit SecB|uniref:Preprotein translocase subunit SecB n=1 Tax=Flavobacterium gillisiae TaxID=150146 RepID=A0A1H4ERI6_9FLAO|nr:protein-export chaperone SecB [Flavobacterium gillisiae]SEA87683.1 preprotein translocase subunit SecB [Flavobacterium gillisiae]
MKSDLKFVNFVVPKFLFEKTDIDADANLFSINPQAVIIRSENKIHINFDIEILDAENNFNLKMLCIGVFDYDTEDEELILNFMSLNGPAIVFPYIRSFVSSYTALSGFDTITLPTLNFLSHQEKLRNNFVDLDSLQDE